MRQRKLAVLIKNLGKLTRTKRQKVVTELTAGARKIAAVEVIEDSTADKPCCPHCGAERVVKNGSSDGLQPPVSG
jgi:transposase-like protein